MFRVCNVDDVQEYIVLQFEDSGCDDLAGSYTQRNEEKLSDSIDIRISCWLTLPPFRTLMVQSQRQYKGITN
eukprot:scaffold3827_cov179-Cylindrotheca_fusiformis.AAC.9